MKQLCKYFLFLFGLFLNYNGKAHSVQVGYCVSCTGELTLYVEHWHGNEDPNSTTMTISLTINGVLSSVTGSPIGNLQDIPFADLPGCVNPITIFGACNNANTYNDWAVFKFPDLPCGLPVIITVQSGSTAFTMDGCGMYPASSPVILVPCNIAPPPVASGDDTVCGSGASVLTLTGFSGAIQWQSATASGGPWTNIPGANATPFSTGIITASQFYRALETGACESNVVGLIVNQDIVSNAGEDIVACTSMGLATIGAANNSNYIYLWEPAFGLNSTTVSNPTVSLSNAAVTKYTLTTSAFGCEKIDSVTVTVNPIPVSNAGADLTVCFSNNLGSIGAVATNGYTYSWSPSIGLADITNSNPTLTLNSPGSFTYIVTTTALNCNSKDTVVVVVNPLPFASVSGTIAVCKGANAQSITFTGGNATAPYSFSYTINGGINQLITTTGGNTASISIPTSIDSVYAFSLESVSDGSATTCSQIQNSIATVTINPLPTASIVGTTAVCKNAPPPNITFSGASSLEPYTFTYSINGIIQPTLTTITGNSISIPAPTNVVGTFLYSLINVKDASATLCSQSQNGSATIIVNPLPIATITGTTSVCKNDSSPTITFTGANATPPYTFTYSVNSGPNETLITSIGNSINLLVPTNLANTYTFSLIDINDGSSTSCSQLQNGSVSVQVNPLPTATIAGTTVLCKNDPSPNITFTGASATAPYTFTYTINGILQPTVTSSGNSAIVLASTNNPGTFVYEIVSVQDASFTNCFQPQNGSATVIVDNLPTASISGTIAVCKDSPSPYITFTGASSLAPYTFVYTINGGQNQTVITTIGNTVSVPAPTDIFGVFLYELVSVQDASSTICYQLQTGSSTVTVYPLPIVDFSFINNCLFHPVFFSDSSTVPIGSNVAWAWDFGDGSFLDTIQNPVYIYGASGTYFVELAITTNNGCKDSVKKFTVVHPNPAVQFLAENVCDGNPVQFNDQTSILTTDTLQSWLWDFGDGSQIDTNQIVSGGHLYTNAGNYTAALWVHSNFGCSDSISKNIAVNPNPSVNFSANDTAGCELFCVNLINSSSIATGSNASWLWDYGDGTFGIEPSHCFSNDSLADAKHFNLALSVKSDSGCSSSFSISNYLTVYPKPTAIFKLISQEETFINPVFEFTDASIGATFWSWNFGDASPSFNIGIDSSSNIVPPPHTYIDTGTYIVMLITSNNFGCIDTAYEKVVVIPEVTFFIPNAFSPNNDGFNDTFIPKGVFISYFEIVIFDRWGNSIFFSDDINKHWDGIANYGLEKAQQDVYVYRIKIIDIYNRKKNYIGNISLLR